MVSKGVVLALDLGPPLASYLGPLLALNGALNGALNLESPAGSKALQGYGK